MGYLSFKKASAAVDLVPADGIVKVSDPDGSGNITLTYNFNGNSANTLCTIQLTAVTDFTIADRNAINVAIGLAAGTSGPAIPVSLSGLLASVTVS